MTYFGETIRKARETKGLTTSQVAEKTHIIVQIVNAMEKEDFHQIKAAIYGRGFVKLICECLDLDPKPLIAEFMDIYEGRRPPVSRDAFIQAKLPAAPSPIEPAGEGVGVGVGERVGERVGVGVGEGIVSAAEVETTVEDDPEKPQTATTADESLKGLDLFDPPPATNTQDIFASAYTPYETAEDAEPSAADKFRTGLSVVSHGVLGSVRGIPRSAWRIAVLVIGVLAVIGLFAWGCAILYRVTEQPAEQKPPQTDSKAQSAKNVAADAKPTAAPATPAAKVNLRSTGQKVPPLYVD